MDNYLKEEKARLLRIIYQYYPKDIHTDHPDYHDTTEKLKFYTKYDNWECKKELEELLVSLDDFFGKDKYGEFRVYEFPRPHDACKSIRITTEAISKTEYHEVVLNISIITKYYSFYRSHIIDGFSPSIAFNDFSDKEFFIIEKTTEKMRDAFSEYKNFPIELMKEKVERITPISGGLLGETTIYESIFTDHIW